MGRLRAAAGVLSLPPTLAHEATHWAVARSVTDDAQLAVEVTGGRAVAGWPPISNPIVRFLAFLGPTVFGSILTAIWLASGIDVDGWRLLLAVGLAVYTVPSPEDVRGALGRQDAQQEA
jgi:hypothetical protein